MKSVYLVSLRDIWGGVYHEVVCHTKKDLKKYIKDSLKNKKMNYGFYYEYRKVTIEAKK